MKRFCMWALAAAVMMAVQTAQAGGWHKVGSFKAGGDAKEMGVNRDCETCMIRVTEGSVIINTVVVRIEAQKDPIKVGTRIEAGNSHEVSLGGRRRVTGLRISDDAKGTYDVYVK